MIGIEWSGGCVSERSAGGLSHASACKNMAQICLSHDREREKDRSESGGVSDCRKSISFTTYNALSVFGVTIYVWFSKIIHIKCYNFYLSHQTGNTNGLSYGCVWCILYVECVIRGGEAFLCSELCYYASWPIFAIIRSVCTHNNPETTEQQCRIHSTKKTENFFFHQTRSWKRAEDERILKFMP